IMPDDLELAQKLAKRLGDAGRGEDRRALLAELAGRFAEEGRADDLEDVAEELAKHDDWEGLLHVAAALPALAGRGAIGEAGGGATGQEAVHADVPVAALARRGHAGEAPEPLRKVVQIAGTAGGDSAADPFRDAITHALKQGPGQGVPAVDEAVAQSGLASP